MPTSAIPLLLARLARGKKRVLVVPNMGNPAEHSSAADGRTIVTVRVLPFSRERVFLAWTHPDLLARWWGPDGFANTFHAYQPHPGGRWHLTMHGPDGRDYDNVSVFREIVPGKRVAFRHESAPVFDAVATFETEGDGATRVTWTMTFEDEKTCAALRSICVPANEQNLDRLTTVLRSLPADAPESRELVTMRTIHAPVAEVYRAWTTRTKEWWCPRPWTTARVDFDLRAGGCCRTIMRGPAGEEVDMTGVFLEVEENARIVFTDGFAPGWVPKGRPFMTGVFTFEDAGDGRTRYTGRARHWTGEVCAEHAGMGFHEGWAKASAQLAELVERPV